MQFPLIFFMKQKIKKKEIAEVTRNRSFKVKGWLKEVMMKMMMKIWIIKFERFYFQVKSIKICFNNFLQTHSYQSLFMQKMILQDLGVCINLWKLLNLEELIMEGQNLEMKQWKLKKFVFLKGLPWRKYLKL